MEVVIWKTIVHRIHGAGIYIYANIHLRTFDRKYPLVMTNIAIENTPFIIDLPIQNGDFL